MSAFDAQLTNTLPWLQHIIYKCVLYQSVSPPFTLLSTWHVKPERKQRVWCIRVLPLDTTFQIVPLSSRFYHDQEPLIVHTEDLPQWTTETGFCSPPWAAPVSSTKNRTPSFQEPRSQRSRYTPVQPDHSLSQHPQSPFTRLSMPHALAIRQPRDSQHHLMDLLSAMLLNKVVCLW